MAKVTSKLQVTIPKAIAEKYGIKPGDEIEFREAGPFIRVVPARDSPRGRLSREESLRLFDQGTELIMRRAKKLKLPKDPPEDRGWTREELYDRGKPR
jgi:AbrB family looped-hinge helix DNA binding protein